MTRTFLALSTLLALLLPPLLPGSARADGSALDQELADYVAARDPVRRLQLALRIAQAHPDPAAVEAGLASAWRYDADEARGEVTWQRESPDGVSHTVFAFVPKDYTPDRAWPVLLYLHGGVGRDQDGGGQEGVSIFGDEAAKKGFLVLAPSTQKGAFWWTPNGVDLIDGSLRDLERRWHVDPNRVWASGMSDGGSGCYHLLAHDPYPFAAFLPLVGNPLVTRLLGGPTWSSNLASRPVFAVSGGKDPLYPAEEMKPLIEEMKRLGCDITWFDEPDAGHDLSYLDSRWEQMWKFLEDHPRDAFPHRVTWTTSRPEGEGRFAWIEILKLAPDAASQDGIEPPTELPTPAPKPHPRLGVRLDTKYDGPGLKIEEVEEGTAAHDAGFLAGDVLVKAGDLDLAGSKDFAALRDYLDGLGEKEGVFVVKRGKETIEIHASPRAIPQEPFPRPQSLGYDVKPGTVVAEVEDGNVIDVETDGVATVRVHLWSSLVDFDHDLVIRVNGKERFHGPAPQDVPWMLAQALKAGPGAPIDRGKVDLTVDGD